MIPLSAIHDINVWLGRSNWPDPSLNASFQEFRIYGGALPPEVLAASYAAGPDALLGGRPRLTVGSSGATIQLAWPADAFGYFLQQSTNLQSGALWTTVTNAPILQGNQETLPLPSSKRSQFFRLRR